MLSHRYQYTVVCAMAAVALLGVGCSTSNPLEIDTDSDSATIKDSDSQTGTSQTDSDTGSDTNKDCDFNDPCGDHGTCNDELGVVICDCDDGWKGATCNQCAANYHLEEGQCVLNEKCMPNSCDGHGTCDDSSGKVKCNCNAGYTGDYCDTCDTGYHFEANNCVADESCEKDNPCGQHGTCSDDGGVVVCSCNDGWTGDTCNQCASGYHLGGEDCVKDEVCLPRTCSGNGTCSVLEGVVSCDCGTGYTGDYCDACDTGYHFEANVCVVNEVCGAGSCNQHGSCDDDTGVIVCECNQGWAGATCDQCAAGYHDDSGNCVLDQQCLPTSCSGQGACSIVEGVVVCACDEGHDPAAYCATCLDNFHLEGSTCVADETCVVGGENDSCSGHGTCEDETGVIVCECATGWAGESCNTCAAGYHSDNGNCVLDQQCMPTSCSGHGTCNDSTGVVVCTCTDNFSKASYCSQCITGFHVSGDVCVLNETCPIVNPRNACNSHGTCDDSTKEIVCTCDIGWTGETCKTCAAGFHPQGDECELDQTCIASSCSYHGTCSEENGVVVCACETGYEATSYCADCAPDYHRNNGFCVADENCVLDPPEEHSCSGHGTCYDSTGEIECDCDTGWGGDTCFRCANGYHLEGENCVLDTTCSPTSCGDHGTCGDDTGVVICTCDPGWDQSTYCADCAAGYHDEGGACVVNETCAFDSCSYHGTCNDSTGVIVCTCDAGYQGDSCDQCSVGYSTCSAECCAANQVCVGGDTCCTPKTCDELDTPAQCGETGQDDVCGGTVHCGECGSNGTCVGNTCDCNDNYGVLSGGHECVYACSGYLPKVGCCDENWWVYCDSGSLQAVNCELYAPPISECGWKSSLNRFTCQEGETTPVQYSEICPANIVVDKNVECEDDGYEPNDDAAGATVLLDDTYSSNSASITGTVCVGNTDLYAVYLRNGETLEVEMYYNETVSNLNMAAFYNGFDGASFPLYYVNKVADRSPINKLTFSVIAGTDVYFTSEFWEAAATDTGTYYLNVVESGIASNGYQLDVTRIVP